MMRATTIAVLILVACLYVPRGWICIKRDPIKNCCIKMKPSAQKEERDAVK